MTNYQLIVYLIVSTWYVTSVCLFPQANTNWMHSDQILVVDILPLCLTPSNASRTVRALVSVVLFCGADVLPTAAKSLRKKHTKLPLKVWICLTSPSPVQPSASRMDWKQLPYLESPWGGRIGIKTCVAPFTTKLRNSVAINSQESRGRVKLKSHLCWRMQNMWKRCVVLWLRSRETPTQENWLQ